MALSYLLNSDNFQQVGRQWPLVAEVAFTYADLTSGATLPLVKLPPGAVVNSVRLRVDAAWNSATSDTFTIKDAPASNPGGSNTVTYLADGSNTNLRTPAVTLSEAANTGYNSYPSGGWLVGTWTGVGAAPNAGTARIYVQYTITGRATEVFENVVSPTLATNSTTGLPSYSSGGTPNLY
jgi:hypothetical protein